MIEFVNWIVIWVEWRYTTRMRMEGTIRLHLQDEVEEVRRMETTKSVFFFPLSTFPSLSRYLVAIPSPSHTLFLCTKCSVHSLSLHLLLFSLVHPHHTPSLNLFVTFPTAHCKSLLIFFVSSLFASYKAL